MIGADLRQPVRTELHACILYLDLLWSHLEGPDLSSDLFFPPGFPDLAVIYRVCNTHRVKNSHVASSSFHLWKETGQDEEVNGSTVNKTFSKKDL